MLAEQNKVMMEKVTSLQGRLEEGGAILRHFEAERDVCIIVSFQV